MLNETVSQVWLRVRRAAEWPLVWHTSVEKAILILFERVGITGADEPVLVLFKPDLAVGQLIETDEVDLLLSVVADRRVSLLDMPRPEGISCSPKLSLAVAGCASRRSLV
jgi:hypothetical protein